MNPACLYCCMFEKRQTKTCFLNTSLTGIFRRYRFVMAYFSRQKTAFNKANVSKLWHRFQTPTSSASALLEQSTVLNVRCRLCQQLKKPPVTGDEIANSVTREDPQETQKRWKSECEATTVSVNTPTSGEKMTEVQKGLILLILLSSVAEVNHIKDHFNHLSKLEQSRTRRPLSCYISQIA